MRRLALVGLLFLVFAPSASALHFLTAPAVFSNVPGPITAEATGPSGAATVTWTDPTATDDTGPVPVTCTPTSGSPFPLGPSTVDCTATGSDGVLQHQPFTVTVVDTTPPSLTNMPSSSSTEASSPSGTVVPYTTPSATDLVDPSPNISCTPSSGTAFPVGANTVTCTAMDSSNNSSQASFTITITDTTKPTLNNVPASFTIEATSPGGTPVGYTLPTATDNGDPAPAVNCSPSSGASFPFGATQVDCTAQDASSNTSNTGSFTVTVVDTTNPVLVGMPSSLSVPATSGAGAVVTYTPPTATDNADPSPAVTCSPASGGTFPLGQTTVTCSADDHHGHTASAPFTVTVTDTAGPVFTTVPNRVVEANGPAGSIVNFATPTATDVVDGPIVGVTCSPSSGSKFPIATTTVTCSASDSHGNPGSTSFNVTVQDTTPPTLVVPAARAVYATTPTGIPDTVSGVVAFLSAPFATDIVDGSLKVTNDAPHFIPVGANVVSFFAKDNAGNVAVQSSTLNVLPQPSAGTPPLPIPPPPTRPAEVKNVKVTPLDGAVRIQWDAGGRAVEITRSSSATRALSALVDEKVVYTGTASSYVDRGLTNGDEYRYVIRAVDAAGNHSAGLAAVVVPRKDLLKSPKDGARLRTAPKLVWAVDPEAQYYNAQLMLNGRKVLSTWPVRPSYSLKKSWKYSGRKYTLKPGLYTWYVFPGYGARSAVHYGSVMGSRTFRIVR